MKKDCEGEKRKERGRSRKEEREKGVYVENERKNET